MNIKNQGAIKSVTVPLILLYLTIFANIVSAQFTEDFEDESANATSFTNSGYTFSISGKLDVENYSNWGYSSSDYFVDNYGNIATTSPEVLGSITLSSDDFYVHSLWLFPSENGLNHGTNGSAILTGKLNGSTKFTKTIASDNWGSSGDNNGFTYIDFSTNSHNTIKIDELQFEVSGDLVYLAIDNFEFEIAPPTISFTDGSSFSPSINHGFTNQALGRFKLTADVSGAILTAASIKLNGTRTGLSNLKLWSSTDASYNSGSDTQIGSTVNSDPGDGSSASFSGFSSSISTSGTYYFLTGDISSEATGEVQGVIVQNSNLTISNGALSGTISNAPLSDSNALLPIELLSFTANFENNNILLRWNTASKINAIGFIIERKSFQETDWRQIASYQTHPELVCLNNQIGYAEYSFTDDTVQPGESYSYRLSDVDVQGNVYVLREIDVNTTGVEEFTDVSLPERTELLPAYPNPFNPIANIQFALPENRHVRIRVCDIHGRQVADLMNKQMNAGNHQVEWNAREMSSGVYLIWLETETFQAKRKCLLIK